MLHSHSCLSLHRNRLAQEHGSHAPVEQSQVALTHDRPSSIVDALAALRGNPGLARRIMEQPRTADVIVEQAIGGETEQEQCHVHNYHNPLRVSDHKDSAIIKL